MKFWNFLSLKVKLISLSLFMSSIVIIVSANSFLGMKTVENDIKDISHISLPNLLNFTEMDLSFRSVRIELRTLGLSGLPQEQERNAIENVNKFIQKFEDSEKKYLAVNFLPGEKELYEEVSKEWKIFKEIGVKVLKLNSTKSSEDRNAMIQIFLKDCPESAERVDIAIQKLMNFHRKSADNFAEDADNAVTSNNVRNLLFGGVGTLLGLLLGAYLSITISTKLSQVVETLESSAAHVASNSQHIASASNVVSQSTTEQSASVAETAASLEQITAMIAKANDNAAKASNQSQESFVKAEKGCVAVDEMKASMQEINDSNQGIMIQIDQNNKDLAEIVSLIEGIRSKTMVINEIVFQTKLLSFNASVEAARAGENGKGFSVVAQEVGSLALMSGNAAKEISDMLNVSSSKVESIVEKSKANVALLIDASKAKIEDGIEKAESCSVILNEIVNFSSRVVELSKEIAQASTEQSQGVSEINKAISQIESVAQQNASASEQTSSSAQELSGQSDALEGLVISLAQVVRGEGGVDPKSTDSRARSEAA